MQNFNFKEFDQQLHDEQKFRARARRSGLSAIAFATADVRNRCRLFTPDPKLQSHKKRQKKSGWCRSEIINCFDRAGRLWYITVVKIQRSKLCREF